MPSQQKFRFSFYWLPNKDQDGCAWIEWNITDNRKTEQQNKNKKYVEIFVIG